MRKAMICAVLLVVLFQWASYSDVLAEYFVFTGGLPPADAFNSANWRYTRYEPYINNNWGTGATDVPGMQSNADYFAVKWRGNIYIPTAGNWTFYTYTDDGVRLYIDGVLRINQWGGIGEYSTGPLSLNVGPHSFEMQYYEGGGGALASLSFEGPGVSKQVIPNSYFNNFYTTSNLPLYSDFDGYDAGRGGGTLYGSASITNNTLQLTPNTGGQYGAWVFSPGIAMYSFDFKCDVYMAEGSANGADGISFSYSDIDGDPTYLGETGDYIPGLAVRLRTYTFNVIELAYNNTTLAFVGASDLKGGWRTLSVRVRRDAASGGATVEVWFNGSRRIGPTSITGWNPPASWKIALGGRTGGEYEYHRVDRLSLYAYDPSVSSITRLSTNPVISGTSSVQYSVLFSEPMYNVDTGDFALTKTGTANAAIQSVSNPTINISEDFSSSPGIGTLVNNAVINGGVLKLTENVNNQWGAWYFTPTEVLNSFTAGFDVRIFDGSSADGLCFCYGKSDNPFGWMGVWSGLTVQFDTYDNGNEFTPALIIKYNGIELKRVKLNDIRSSSYIPIRVRVTQDGICSVYQTDVGNGFVPRAHVRMPEWAPQSDWAISFFAATGGANDRHYVDNLAIVNNKRTVTLGSLSGLGTVRLDVSSANDMIHFQNYALYPKAYTSGQTYSFDLVRPTVLSVQVFGPHQVDVTFSEAMGDGVTTATNYAISGTGKGTLATNPSSVALLSGATYRLTWNTGEMLQGGDITISVSNVKDAVGNTIGSPNSGTHSGGGTMMDAPTVSEVTTSKAFTNTFPVTINYTGAADTSSGVSRVELWLKQGSGGT
ncbi:MAG TPA: PA14 domain-containing protein, partial [Candidatus Hydrogenedens sp.]|nr:PA14 domain-containing protein [Candidatus Hydrogenedens sp.]